MPGYRDTWNDYTQRRRCALLASSALGLLIVVLGVAGDLFHLWSNLTFVPNAVTSLAGFLIGVPVALVILETWTTEREVNSRREEAIALSEAAWDQFVVAVNSFCSDDRIEACRFVSDEVAIWWENIRIVLIDYLKFIGTKPNKADADVAVETLRMTAFEWTGEMTSILKKISQIGKGLPESRRLELEWLNVYRAWTHLDGYVRGRRHEWGLADFPDNVDTTIRIDVMYPGSPLGKFSSLHDSHHKYMDHPNFVDLGGFLQNIAGLTDPYKMVDFLRIETSGLYTFKRWDYREAARLAGVFLKTLRQEVASADRQKEWLARDKSKN